jgi:hypothetical protein
LLTKWKSETSRLAAKARLSLLVGQAESGKKSNDRSVQICEARSLAFRTGKYDPSGERDPLQIKK